VEIKVYENNIYGLYKPAGHTPLQALLELKQVRPELTDIPLTYAGRLDPMAEGLLLVLAGEAVHEKENYLKLDKTYEVTALLGIETDSWDLLGIPFARIERSVPIYRLSMAWPINRHTTKIQEVLTAYVGTPTLPLPPYSSPPHKGKPLFWWAQRKLISADDAPTKEMTIYKVDDCVLREVSSSELLDYIQITVPNVDGNFRQAEIVQAWNNVLADKSARYITASFTVICASGTYIRSLVHDLGKKLGTGACIYKLTRTNIGPYTL
jgi:tRNA pseudouridine55 synthase